eukprot:2805652-Alexandrium_andersonii.AAC.1
MAWPAGRQRAGPPSTASTPSACPAQPAPNCLATSTGKQRPREAGAGRRGGGERDTGPINRANATPTRVAPP